MTETKRRWGEIINPSDKCFICIDDPAAAAVATLYVSRGQYAVKSDKDGEEDVLPLFLFAKADDVEAFFQKRYGCSWKDVPTDRIEAAAQTAQYGDPEEIEGIDAALAGLPDKDERRKKYEDKKRSSLNRIVDAFHALKFKKVQVPRG